MLVWGPHRRHPERHALAAYSGSILVATINNLYTVKNPQRSFLVQFGLPGGLPIEQRTTQHAGSPEEGKALVEEQFKQWLNLAALTEKIPSTEK